jgi:predicted nucleotide-binding protein
MATKRKPTIGPQRNPDSLIIERTIFKTKLEERIELGKNLLNRLVTKTDQAGQLEVDYYKWDNYNSEYLKQAFNNENNTYKITYDDVNDWVGRIFGGPDTAQERYRHLREKIGNKIGNLEELVEKVDLLKSELSELPVIEESTSSISDSNNVFIVHGHNIAIQQSVARVIEKLGLNPVILGEQPNQGKTVIEKFEKYSNVGFAIIILTDDDEGKSKSEINMKNRARQNVILELGYFNGKLGRERVLPLYSEGVELPSDIHGLLYTPLDKAGNWKFAIVQELKAAGYTVDANKLLN